MDEEYFDIVNPDGTSAGYAVPRSQAHREGLWHRSTHVWIFDRRGRILLQRRALTKDTHPGLWDISAAGHLLAGEASIIAAEREVREELGIAIPATRIRFRFADHEEHVSGEITDREFHDIHTALITDEEAAMVHPDPIELCDVRWLTADEFKIELRDAPERFVPHKKEYEWIIDMIKADNASTSVEG